MSAASNYLEKKLLDSALGITSFTQTAGNIRIALFTGTAATVLANLENSVFTNEVSTTGTGYARVSLNTSGSTNTSGWTAATEPTSTDTAGYYEVSNTNAITFSEALLDWGTITCVAVVDNTASKVLFYGAVTVEKTIQAGDTFQISAGQLKIRLS